MSDIRELQEVIWKTHGAVAEHTQSVPVKEFHGGNLIWQGVVEVFRLIGHPKTDKVYAWTHETDDPEHPKRSVTVLQVHPIQSARDAVRAAIVQEIKGLGTAE